MSEQTQELLKPHSHNYIHCTSENCQDYLFLYFTSCASKQ